MFIDRPVNGMLKQEEQRTNLTSTFKHTGRYDDLVTYEIEGSWVAAESGDAIVYTLTPDDTTEPVVTLTVNKDGSAVYAPEGGEEVKMHSLTGPAAVWNFVGDGPEVSGAVTKLTLSVLNDGSAVLNVEAFGTVLQLDQGTWEQVNEYTFKAILDNAGEVESELIDSTPSFNISIPGTQIGDVESTLAIVLPEEGGEEAAE